MRSTKIRSPVLPGLTLDAFHENKVTRVAWIDLHRSFDKVWIDGLIVKLKRNGVANNILKWIQSHLFNRRAQISLDQLSSRKIFLRQGVPQCDFLSPTLFLLFINDLVSESPRGVKAALYADDMVLQDLTSHWPTYSMDWGLVCHCQQGQILHNTIHPVTKETRLVHTLWTKMTKSLTLV